MKVDDDHNMLRSFWIYPSSKWGKKGNWRRRRKKKQIPMIKKEELRRNYSPRLGFENEVDR